MIPESKGVMISEDAVFVSAAFVRNIGSDMVNRLVIEFQEPEVPGGPLMVDRNSYPIRDIGFEVLVLIVGVLAKIWTETR
jgi:hypothetical protein